MKEIKENIKKWMSWFVFAVLLMIMYKLIDNFSGVSESLKIFVGIVKPFLLGLLVAYILYLPERKIEIALHKSKIKFLNKNARKLGILAIYVIAIFVIVTVINWIFPIIKQSAVELTTNFQDYYNAAISKYNSLPSDSLLKQDSIEEMINNLKNINIKDYINVDKVSTYAKGALNAVTGIFDVFVTLVVSVYALSERTEIMGFIRKGLSVILNKKTFANVNKYINSSNQIFFKFLASQFLDAIVVGFLVTIALSIMNIKYAVLIGFMIGLFNMIPYFGAIFAIGISIIITAITGGLYQALWMAITVIILQQVDANIINPKIVGDSLKISPLLIILSVTIGGAYFGVLGMFLAVPIAAVLKIVVNDYLEYKSKNKNEKKISYI